MKLIFFGTPGYVNPILDYLIENENLIAVVTKSDKPAKRHLVTLPSGIKKNALEKKIPIFTPENIQNQDFISNLSDIKPDLAIVAAYGKILPKKVLDIFPNGCINIHFSLLPKYCGAAPIQWALINGEANTGITSFWMDEGMDTGRIISQKKIEIDKNDDTISLQKKLIPIALDVLKETLKKAKNEDKGIEQTGSKSYAPPLKKEDGKIIWEKSAEEIYCLVRGTKPWPGAYTEVQSSKFVVHSLKILDAEIVNQTNYLNSESFTAGTVIALEKNVGFVLKCGSGYLLVKSVQPASKNIMSAWAFLQGYNLKIGDKLG
ncbi:MAG: methionyl-tRNA formyltransferase [Elusimicrobia bacterium RIFOXYD2_FULL_34_15]|nr:MAG: methionyl-tRNA formyltransferase [Elusimicrobia bacterium RIFOXYD2_FULL_34_15]